MRLLVLSLVLLPLAACDSSSTDGLEGTWSLARVEQAGTSVPFVASTLTLGPDGEYTSRSCDTCSGTYRAGDDEVRFVISLCAEACADIPATPAVEDLELSGVYGIAFQADSLALIEPLDLGGRVYVFAPEGRP